MLRAKYPRIRVFLDVDDLDDISRLEEHVRHCDAVLVFLTQSYILSANCRRELIAALAYDKPLIVVRETDLGHGAATEVMLAAEVAMVPEQERDAALRLSGKWVEAIEWYREHYLKTMALLMVEEALPCLADTSAEDGLQEAAEKGVGTALGGSLRGLLKKSRSGWQSHR